MIAKGHTVRPYLLWRTGLSKGVVAWRSASRARHLFICNRFQSGWKYGIKMSPSRGASFYLMLTGIWIRSRSMLVLQSQTARTNGRPIFVA